MIVVDTTVLVHATGADHDYREPCRSLISLVAEGGLDATTTVEVIQEFAHVRARRRGRADATSLATDYADLFSPLMVVTTDDLRRGLSMFQRADRLGAFDAVLAAAAAARGAVALVSADRAFAEAPGLAHVIPDAAGITSLGQL